MAGNRLILLNQTVMGVSTQVVVQDSKVERRKVDGILILAMNNPPANTYSHEMLRELDQLILDARFDETTHVIILTGKLEHFFSAGGDLKVLVNKSLQYKYNFALHGQELLSRMTNTPKLIIAAINGHAIGGGLELAMAADIRIGRKDGGRIGLTEGNLGVMPGMGGTQMMPRLVKRATALELCSVGRQIAFEEALELGLIHSIYQKSNYMEQVLQYARQFVPHAREIGKLKQALYHGIECPLGIGDLMQIETEAGLQLIEK